jgi:hypothetical protein
MHLSNNGSHFKNNVIKELHRFTWANETVIVVDNANLKILQSLISEFI